LFCDEKHIWSKIKIKIKKKKSIKRRKIIYWIGLERRWIEEDGKEGKDGES